MVVFAVLAAEMERLCREEPGLCRATLQQASAQLEFGHAFVLCFKFENRYESGTKKAGAKSQFLHGSNLALFLHSGI